MEPPKGGLDSELESFRRQWLSDLQTKGHGSRRHAQSSDASASSSTRPIRKRIPSSSSKKPTLADDDEGYVEGHSFDEAIPNSVSKHVLDEEGGPAEKPLVSALDHYEEAMEKEAQGNMGDSLKLYRKAYRVSSRHG